MKFLAVAVFLALWCAGPAHADQNPANERDTRHCVTTREPWTTPRGLTRPEVERRWDVRGKGRIHRDHITGMVEWIYPMCDLRFPHSYAAAVFNGRHILVAVATLEQDDSQPASTAPVPPGEPQILPG